MVTQEILPPPDIPDIDDQSDNSSATDSQGTNSTTQLDSSTGDNSDQGDSADNEDDQDSTTYPGGGEAPSSARDGWDIFNDAINQVGYPNDDQDEPISAFDPPRAVDAAGQEVSTVLTKTSDGLALQVLSSASTSFPVEVTLEYGFDPDTNLPPGSDTSDLSATPDSANTLSALTTQAAQVSPSCPDDRPQVIISYGGPQKNYKDLAYAFKRFPTTCAVYNVSIPDTSTELGILPRGTGPLSIKKLNRKARTEKAKTTYKYWNNSGARFKPVAEMNYGEALNSPLTLEQVGIDAAQSPESSDYPMWSIDEAPCEMVDEPNGGSWQSLVKLVSGLSSANAKGVIYNCYRRQNDIIRRVYTASDGVVISAKAQRTAAEKQNLERLYTNKNWSKLSSARFFAQESYTMCSTVCVAGSKLKKRAAKTNAYMQHPARLAFASDAPDTTARSFYETRYLPLIDGWAPVNNSQQTGGLSLSQIEGLVSLQVYAARAWDTTAHPYAGSRIGVRWTNAVTSNWTTNDRRLLANRIAQSVAAAYNSDGSAKKVCRTVKHCMPVVENASFTNAWTKFQKWTTPTGNKKPSPPNPEIATGDPENYSELSLAFDPPDSWQSASPLTVTYEWKLCDSWSTDECDATNTWQSITQTTDGQYQPPANAWQIWEGEFLEVVATATNSKGSTTTSHVWQITRGTPVQMALTGNLVEPGTSVSDETVGRPGSDGTWDGWTIDDCDNQGNCFIYPASYSDFQWNLCTYTYDANWQPDWENPLCGQLSETGPVLNIPAGLIGPYGGSSSPWSGLADMPSHIFTAFGLDVPGGQCGDACEGWSDPSAWMIDLFWRYENNWYPPWLSVSWTVTKTGPGKPISLGYN